MQSIDTTQAVANAATDGTAKDANRGVDKISQMPLDILREIFSLLHPTAVLRLAQTCKAFRKYLMNPALARKTVWVPALEAVECLPPCPKDISEPRFTYLMFYSRCDDCLLREADKIINFYSTHQMLCFECIPKHYAADLSDIPGACDKQISALISPSTVPTVRLSNGIFGGSPVSHIASVKKIIEEYQAIDPDDSDAVKALRKRWESSTRERYWASNHEEECRSFIESQRRIYDRVRKQRYQEVIERLSALGYSAECRTFISERIDDVPRERRAKWAEFESSLDTYIWYREYRRLTDQEWQQLQKEIIPFMEYEREYRLEEHRAECIVERIKEWFKPAFLGFIYSQPPNTVLTTAAELAFMPEWREALLSKPIEEDLSTEDINGAVALMPVSCEKIRRWKTQQLVEIVRKSKTYEGQNVTEDTLSLASTIFRCSHCEQCFTCTTALVHRCCYFSDFSSEAEVVFEGASHTEHYSDSHDLTRRSATNEEVLINRAIARWGGQHFDYWKALQSVTFDDAAHSHMVKLLDTIGRESTTLTVEMEKQQPYVEVLCSCYKKSEEDQAQRRAMNWLDAMNLCSRHSVEGESEWYALLHDQDLDVVAKCRQKRLQDVNGYFPHIWAIHKSRNVDRDYFFEQLLWDNMRHPEGIEATKAYVYSMTPYILPRSDIASCIVALRALPHPREPGPQSKPS